MILTKLVIEVTNAQQLGPETFVRCQGIDSNFGAHLMELRPECRVLSNVILHIVQAKRISNMKERQDETAVGNVILRVYNS